MMEGLMVRVFRDVIGVEVSRPIPRMTYREAMDRFGVDKPDTRFGLEITDYTGELGNTGFRVFADVVSKGGVIRGITAPGMADASRSELAALEEVAKVGGARGLSWWKVTESGLASPIAKHFGNDQLEALRIKSSGKPGDLILIVADEYLVACDSLARLRLHIGEKADLIDRSRYDFLWVTDFPLLEWDKEEQRYLAMHHPFTAPLDEDVPLLDTGPEEARRKFGFLLEALEFGAPPHGGIAFGLDRLAMILAGAKSLRDVIAFPKTQKGSCLMTDAPSPVDPKQLRELHIRVTAPEQK